MSVGGGAEGGVAAVGGHPDFGMSGVSVPGSSGFGEQRGFGNNVGPIGLATNPSLQHDIMFQDIQNWTIILKERQ